jgi:hypothetical protein
LEDGRWRLVVEGKPVCWSFIYEKMKKNKYVNARDKNNLGHAKTPRRHQQKRRYEDRLVFLLPHVGQSQKSAKSEIKRGRRNTTKERKKKNGENQTTNKEESKAGGGSKSRSAGTICRALH